MKPIIKYSELKPREMFRLYNAHALKIGKPPLRKIEHDRVRMAAALATLLTYRAPPEPAKPQPGNRNTESRLVVIEELCKISHYESITTGDRVEVADRGQYATRLLISYGFPYSVVLDRIKRRLPKSKVSGPSLRVHAANARQGKNGYESAKLPDKRPHSSKGVSHDDKRK